jgi:quercetin dioxygenase-like cupin family protein
VIRAGDTIENPITRERILFRETSAETNGGAVVIECVVDPGGAVAAKHVHPHQDERFELLDGELTFDLDKQELTAGPGDTVLVPAGTPHRFRNTGGGHAHFVCEVRPALQFEQLLETMFALAADGKTNGNGMPNPLRLAVIARATFDTVRLPFPPAWLQRLGLSLGAPLGRMLGYKPTYTPTPARAKVGAAAA